VTRLIALVPAAGHGLRMNRPNKLTLPLPGQKRSVIQAVIEALEQGGADQVVVIAPPVSRPGAVILANHARVAGAEVIHLATDTPDMRSTIAFGLDALEAHAFAPEAVLLTPGDLPRLTAAAVWAVADAARNDPHRIIVPTHNDRRGHPVALPWSIALRLDQLPDGVGANALIAQHADRVRLLPWSTSDILADLDTPEDYQKLQKSS
jgi:molybdenum cofactor cytidylyltransferase